MYRGTKLDVLDFNGDHGPEAFFNWIHNLKVFFRWYELANKTKFFYAKAKLQGTTRI